MSFKDQYGPWAFIAGASQGIGGAYSEEAAKRGLNVVLMARGKEALDAKAAEIASTYGVETRTLAGDLAADDVIDQVRTVTDDIEVGLFVYNAAMAPAGDFLDVPLDDHLRSILMNCTTPTKLAHHFAGKMKDRGRGGLALIGSMGGLEGSIHFSTYNSGKAYEWVLAETLWAELKPHGVDATCQLVGATNGANYKWFQETLDPELCKNRESDNPLDVARWRLMNPVEPHVCATTLYDNLGDGPVCFSTPEDEFVASKMFAMSRAEIVQLWVEIQNTTTRLPEHDAR
ncbi:MAG: SDR family NAD(P)-dependent oxidoreductase [Acidimicrobiia bacterium]